MIMIEKVGVIGAGQMGTGIAHVCGLAGIDVVMVDLDAGVLEEASEAISHNLDRQIRRGLIAPEDKDAALTHIVTSMAYEDVGDCDLVVEVVNEDEELKRAVYKRLIPLMKPDAILATNTSSLPITRLAAATDRPERFIGMHFMNPVPVMQLIEIIRGIATGEEAYQRVKELCLRLGKVPAVSEDFPAFIVNRILLPMVNEAVYTLYEGVGGVEAIDTALKLGANHPMGPLELADFIGLDTCLNVMNVLYEGLADSKYRPCPLLVKYVEAGWLGRKSGRGFYDYSGENPVPTR
jgi:3-hydroxybutyryl-CoA dehydrogenase